MARFKALLPFFLQNVFLSDRGSGLEMAIWQLVVVLVLVGTVRSDSEFIDEW